VGERRVVAKFTCSKTKKKSQCGGGGRDGKRDTGKKGEKEDAKEDKGGVGRRGICGLNKKEGKKELPGKKSRNNLGRGGVKKKVGGGGDERWKKL